MVIVTRARAVTLAAAALGAGLFVWLHLPLPVLLGPMAGCLVAALAGAELQSMGGLGTLMRTILGVAIGSTITPALVGSLPGYGVTLAMMPLLVFACGILGYPFFRRIMGFDHPTAYYAAMPGGLQDMLIFGEEAGGDVRAMSLVHATRVLVIVTLVPAVMTWAYGLDLTRPPGRPVADFAIADLALMTAAALGGWAVAARARMFGASILGPMIATAALSLSGLISTRPPVEAIWAAQFFIGIAVGARYSGITARELRVDVLAGLLYAVLLALVSLAFVAVAARVSPAHGIDIGLAFLPGGQAEMAMIAIVAGSDVAFVVAHHVLRIFVVIVFAPVVQRRFGN